MFYPCFTLDFGESRSFHGTISWFFSWLAWPAWLIMARRVRSKNFTSQPVEEPPRSQWELERRAPWSLMVVAGPSENENTGIPDIPGFFKADHHFPRKLPYIYRLNWWNIHELSIQCWKLPWYPLFLDKRDQLNLDLEPFGWPRTGKLKEFYKTELKRTNNEHPYQNIYKISGTILIYFDLHHSTFWFWPSLHLPKRFLAQNSSATTKCSEV